MRNHFVQTLFFLQAWAASAAFSQSAQISGTVYDVETLQPLSGVVIVLEGTKIGAETNESGTFHLWAPDSGNFILSTSLVGYERTSRMLYMSPGVRIELSIYLASLEFVAPQLPIARRSEGDWLFRSHTRHPGRQRTP